MRLLLKESWKPTREFGRRHRSDAAPQSEGLEPAGAGPEARLFAGEHAPRQRRARAAVGQEHVDQVHVERTLIGAGPVVIRRFVTGGHDWHTAVVGCGARWFAVISP